MLASEIWGNEEGIFFNFLAIKKLYCFEICSWHIRNDEGVYFSREIAEKKFMQVRFTRKIVYFCFTSECDWKRQQRDTQGVWEVKFIVACVFVSNFQNSSKAVMRRRVNICDSFTTTLHHTRSNFYSHKKLHRWMIEERETSKSWQINTFCLLFSWSWPHLFSIHSFIYSFIDAEHFEKYLKLIASVDEQARMWKEHKKYISVEKLLRD